MESSSTLLPEIGPCLGSGKNVSNKTCVGSTVVVVGHGEAHSNCAHLFESNDPSRCPTQCQLTGHTKETRIIPTSSAGGGKMIKTFLIKGIVYFEFEDPQK